MIKKIWYSIFKLPPRALYSKVIGKPVGVKLGKLFSKQIARDFFERENAKEVSFFFTGVTSIKQHALLTAINIEIEKLPENERASINQRLFWGNEAGLKWHETRSLVFDTKEAYETKYLSLRKEFMKAIESQLSNVEHVVEIGSGNARFLYHLYDQFFCKWPAISITGVEINQAIINKCEAARQTRAIQFLNLDFLKFANLALKENTLIYATGTLEMLLEAELREVLQILKTKENVYLCLCEPVDKGYEASVHSTYRHTATFYSHHYQALLKEAGFTILFELKPNYSSETNNLLTLLAKNK
jgi:hypothetical protein